jgi:hypothetical protein
MSDFAMEATWALIIGLAAGMVLTAAYASWGGVQ